MKIVLFEKAAPRFLSSPPSWNGHAHFPHRLVQRHFSPARDEIKPSRASRMDAYLLAGHGGESLLAWPLRAGIACTAPINHSPVDCLSNGEV